VGQGPYVRRISGVFLIEERGKINSRLKEFECVRCGKGVRGGRSKQQPVMSMKEKDRYTLHQKKAKQGGKKFQENP